MNTVVDAWRCFLQLFGLSKDRDNDDRQDDVLATAICGLTCAINASAEQRRNDMAWLRSHAGLATKNDLCELEKRLLMTAQELEQLLNNRTTQIIKISAEQAGRFDTLTAKFAELTVLIEAGGAITPAIVAAAEALGVAADNLDAAIPDAVPTPPPA